MFPSNSNGNYNDPFTFIDPFSKQEDLPLSFFHFPSPYYNQCEIELEDHDVFLNQHHMLLHQQTLTDHNSVSDTIVNMPDSNKNDESTTERCTKKSNNNGTIEGGHQQLVRKRSFSKKDRHSKINTAKGPRDRRMRLSLDVARDFFGLQDMLGFDKASKTIEWLLLQAKQEIKNLSRSFVADGNHYSSSSTSEGEVVSGINKASIEGSSSKVKPSKKGKKVRQPRKTSFRPLAKDLREKARARAKARTTAKIMCTQRINNSCLQAVGEAEVKEFGSRPDDDLMTIIRGVMVDESSEIRNRWTPNSMFNCLQNGGTNQVQEHQLTGFASFGKPWET